MLVFFFTFPPAFLQQGQKEAGRAGAARCCPRNLRKKGGRFGRCSSIGINDIGRGSDLKSANCEENVRTDSASGIFLDPSAWRLREFQEFIRILMTCLGKATRIHHDSGLCELRCGLLWIIPQGMSSEFASVLETPCTMHPVKKSPISASKLAPWRTLEEAPLETLRASAPCSSLSYDDEQRCCKVE